jgi:hypothetical protein
VARSGLRPSVAAQFATIHWRGEAKEPERNPSDRRERRMESKASGAAASTRPERAQRVEGASRIGTHRTHGLASSAHGYWRHSHAKISPNGDRDSPYAPVPVCLGPRTRTFRTASSARETGACLELVKAARLQREAGDAPRGSSAPYAWGSSGG